MVIVCGVLSCTKSVSQRFLPLSLSYAMNARELDYYRNFHQTVCHALLHMQLSFAQQQAVCAYTKAQ
jgi:hypothetical protein